MKLNSNTTPNGTNKPETITLHDTLWAMQKEAWTLENLAHIGKKAAFDEVESGALAHQFEVIEQRTAILHQDLHSLSFSDEVKALSQTPQAQNAQVLMNLLSTMLKHWRNQEISGNEFEEWLETSVSLASSLLGVKP